MFSHNCGKNWNTGDTIVINVDLFRNKIVRIKKTGALGFGRGKKETF